MSPTRREDAVLDFHVAYFDDEVVVVLRGTLNTETRSVCAMALAQAFSGRPDRLVVDLSQLSMPDAGGETLLDTARRLAAAQGVQFVLRVASGSTA